MPNGGKSFAILTMILAGVSAVLLYLGMSMLAEIRTDIRDMKKEVVSHFINHPDRALSERLSTVETEIRNMKGNGAVYNRSLH